MIVKLILWYLICYAAGAVVFRVVARTMTKGGHLRINFMGRYIPTSLGIGYALLSIIMILAASILKNCSNEFGSQLMIIVGAFCLLGLMDDLIQTREKGGFKGHLARMGAEGDVSTALLKAFFGLAVSLLAASLFWRNEGWLLATVNALIVALSANAVNLLDVRPGRAVKGFCAASLFILIGSLIGALTGGKAGILPVTWFLIGPFLIWTAAYAGIDFKCRGMMGDAGSNVLGAVLGLLVVWELSAPMRWVTLGLLIGFHLFTEAVSLTLLVERVGLLKRIDSLWIKPE